MWVWRHLSVSFLYGFCWCSLGWVMAWVPDGHQTFLPTLITWIFLSVWAPQMGTGYEVIFVLATVPDPSLLFLTGSTCCPNPVPKSAPGDLILVRRVCSERWRWLLHQGFSLYRLDPQSHQHLLNSPCSLSQQPQTWVYHPWPCFPLAPEKDGNRVFGCKKVSLPSVPSWMLFSFLSPNVNDHWRIWAG